MHFLLNFNDDNFYQDNEPSLHNIRAHNNCSSNNHRSHSHNSSRFHSNNHNSYRSIFHHHNTRNYRSLATLFFSEKFKAELVCLLPLLYQYFFFDIEEPFENSDRNCFCLLFYIY